MKRKKFFRKCGCCGERYVQAEMIRDSRSSSGWFCRHCYNYIAEESENG